MEVGEHEKRTDLADDCMQASILGGATETKIHRQNVLYSIAVYESSTLSLIQRLHLHDWGVFDDLVIFNNWSAAMFTLRENQLRPP